MSREMDLNMRWKWIVLDWIEQKVQDNIEHDHCYSDEITQSILDQLQQMKDELEKTPDKLWDDSELSKIRGQMRICTMFQGLIAALYTLTKTANESEMDHLRTKLEQVTLQELSEKNELSKIKMENAKLLVRHEMREKELTKRNVTIRGLNNRIKKLEQRLTTTNRKKDEQLKEKINYRVKFEELNEKNGLWFVMTYYLDTGELIETETGEEHEMKEIANHYKEIGSNVHLYKAQEIEIESKRGNGEN